MRLQRACLWLFCSSLVLVSGSSDKDLENDMTKRVEEKVLSRKRRYLTFPEGSSLQVVYDQTIPIVNLPLMYTIGVTVAIAYELPSKPWYQYAKEIRQNIKNGAYLRRKDQNVTQLTYTDQGQIPYPAKTNLLNVAPSLNYYPNAYPKHSYYYKDSANVNPLNGDKAWNRVSSPVYYGSRPPLRPAALAPTKLEPVSNKLGYYFGQSPNQKLGIGGVANQLSQWMKHLPLLHNDPKKPIYWSDVVKGIKQMASRRKDVVPVTGGVNQLPVPISYGWKKTHKKPVLPVFGKRSVDSHLVDSEKQQLQQNEEIDQEANQVDDEELLDKLIDEEEQKHFTRHHRKTRHDLFSKIEVYLNSKGMNGRECVLKTLCETGHKHQAHHLPNTFAAELIKTIFRLPPRTNGEELTTDVHVAYDLAHHHQLAALDDCADLYPKCTGDFWTLPIFY